MSKAKDIWGDNMRKIGNVTIIVLLIILNIFCFKASSNENNVNFGVEAVILNNPKFHVYNELPYKTLDWQSTPQIKIKIKSISNVDKATLEINVLNNFSKLIYSATKEITFKDYFSSMDIELEKPLDKPKFIEIKIYRCGCVECKYVPVNNFNLHGKVTDFEGNPISNAWITVLNDRFQIAASDSEGNYLVNLPKGEYNCIAAATNLYPRKQLENYIWNLPLYCDTKYDFKLGRAEVFRLMADAMTQN
ncbi:MAG TPA: carboxypeptidase-like regulatory domain-containing protein, partial [Candidatus Wallbacteria bacterium]|nr:carboxypeptidase-like regulatory domain-containing protein [Candidatus Wallbacteria bacterium]